jgi:hypothetical protein
MHGRSRAAQLSSARSTARRYSDNDGEDHVDQLSRGDRDRQIGEGQERRQNGYVDGEVMRRRKTRGPSGGHAESDHTSVPAIPSSRHQHGLSIMAAQTQNDELAYLLPTSNARTGRLSQSSTSTGLQGDSGLSGRPSAEEHRDNARHQVGDQWGRQSAYDLTESMFYPHPCGRDENASRRVSGVDPLRVEPGLEVSGEGAVMRGKGMDLERDSSLHIHTNRVEPLIDLRSQHVSPQISMIGEELRNDRDLFPGSADELTSSQISQVLFSASSSVGNMPSAKGLAPLPPRDQAEDSRALADRYASLESVQPVQTTTPDLGVLAPSGPYNTVPEDDVISLADTTTSEVFSELDMAALDEVEDTDLRAWHREEAWSSPSPGTSAGIIPNPDSGSRTLSRSGSESSLISGMDSGSGSVSALTTIGRSVLHVGTPLVRGRSPTSSVISLNTTEDEDGDWKSEDWEAARAQ